MFFYKFSESHGYNNSLDNVDLVDTDTQLKLIIDVPGMKREDIRVELDEGLLRVSAERKLSDEGVRHRGRRQINFSKIFELDETLDPKRISAKCVDGVLEICLEKSKKSRQRIDIE